MKLELNWPLNLDGYHLEKEAEFPDSLLSTKNDPRKPGEGHRIVEKRSGKKVRQDFQDRLKVPALWKQLADCEINERGALSFVSKFGFLRQRSGHESASFICNEIIVMQSLIAAHERGDWDSLILWMVENQKAIRIAPDLFVDKQDRRIELFFRPSTLIDAIHLQFFQDITSSVNIGKCRRPGCPEYFYYGSGLPHRSTAKYCSVACQKKHAYQKTKE